MPSSNSFTPIHRNNQPVEPSDDIIRSNLKHLKIRPKDVEDIVKDSQNAYKMVFEQVFLVIRCIRYLITDERSALAVRGRMGFLLTVFDSQESANQEVLDNIQKNILQKLEDNIGSNDMIAYLQTLESEESNSILRRMQENGVAFAPITYNHGQSFTRPYAYYDMHMCLQYPLEIFRKLLSKKIYEATDIEKLIYNKIKYHAESFNPKGSASKAMIIHKDMPKEQQQHIFDLSKEENFAQIIEDYTPNNKDSILCEIRRELAIDLGKWASDIFAKISNPSYSRSTDMLGRARLTFNDSFDISRNSGRTTISIQSGLVENLHKLNQLDDLFESLKLALKAKLDSHKALGRPHERENALNNEDTLADISAWYDRYSTGMFKKIDQIPKAIVSIIYFDLENGFPSMNHVLHNAKTLRSVYNSLQGSSATKKASPVKERNLLLTCINSLYLYLDGDKSYNNLDELFDRINNKNTQNIKSLARLHNPIMSLWTVFEESDNGSLDASFGETEQDQMMYRFKTVPVFFKRSPAIELSELIQKISDQSSNKNPAPFPYNSAFPWPLWIKKSHDSDRKVYTYIGKILGYQVYDQSFIKNMQSSTIIARLK